MKEGRRPMKDQKLMAERMLRLGIEIKITADLGENGPVVRMHATAKGSPRRLSFGYWCVMAEFLRSGGFEGMLDIMEKAVEEIKTKLED